MASRPTLLRTARRGLKQALHAAGLDVRRVYPPQILEPWKDDPACAAALAEAAERSLVDPLRLYMLFQLAQQAAALPGDVGEFGVYRGGSARVLWRALRSRPGGRDKRLLLFDTFAGIPRPTTTHDPRFAGGELADTSLELVRGFVGDDRVEYFPGLFSDTFAGLGDRRFSLVHIDCDLYESALQCCRELYGRVVPGGAMIFDDYGFLGEQGVKRAVDEFFADRPEQPLYLPTGQALVVRWA